MINILIDIYEVGTGTNASIGMYDGDFKWSQATTNSNYAGGFIDRNTVSSVLSACNITRGGAFGGFQGTVSIGVYSKSVVDAILSNVVTLIGKVLTIKVDYVSDDDLETVSQRFIGKVSTYKVDSENNVTISVATDTAFDAKKLPSITVTKEMALNADNTAVGKKINSVFGQIVDFPLIHVLTDNQNISLLVQNNLRNADNPSGIIVAAGTDSDQSTAGFGFPMSTFDAWFKPKDSLYVIDKWQAAEDSRVWIHFGFCKESAFGWVHYWPATEINVRRELVGRRIKVTKGTSAGKFFEIEDVKYRSPKAGLWFQVSTNNLSDFTETGFPATAYKPDQIGPTDARFIVSDDNKIDNDVSFITFVGTSNIFLLSSKCDATTGKIVGLDESTGKETETEVPVDSIQVIHQTDNWQMIKVNVAGIVNDDENSFGFAKFVPAIEARYRKWNNQNIIRMGLTYGDDEYEDVGDFDFWHADSVTEDQFTSETPTTETLEFPGGEAAANTARTINLIYIPLSGKNIAEATSSVYVVPKIQVACTWSEIYGGTTNPFARIKIELAAFNNGGVCLGNVTSNTKWTYSSLTSEESLMIDIDPDEEVMRFSGQIVGYDTESKEAFTTLKSQLDISKVLSGADLKSVTFVSVSVQVYLFSGEIFILESSSSGSCIKNVFTPRIAVTQKASKDKVYLRAKYKATPTEVTTLNASTPAGLLQRIANIIQVPTDGFFEQVAEKQWALFSTGIGVDTDCQYHTSENESFSDVATAICRQSLMAVWQKPNGEFSARWFMDDDLETTVSYEFSDVIAGSFSVDKPSGGYLSTDFVFDIVRRIFIKPESLSVNTDQALTSFPASGYHEASGDALTTTGGWDFLPITEIDVYSSTYGRGYRALRVRKTGLGVSLLDRFVIGTYWKVGDGTDAGTVLCYIAAVAPDFNAPTGTSGVRIALQYETPRPTTWNITQIAPVSPVEQWKDLVSGLVVNDYTTARNIWEHAQNARLKIGVEKKASSDFTKLTQAIWGSDSMALLNWVLYTVMYNTREKTVIRFRVPMDNNSINLSLLDYVRFKYGPYATINGTGVDGTLGWIVELEDDYANAQIAVTLLTSISDTDALIIDERLADGSLLIDEVVGSTKFFDEGKLA